MIVFQRLTFKNFLSVGNQEVTINLNDTKTTLIHGANGSGKSTVLDALTYSLFNKPARNINLPQLLNAQNKKGLLTEVQFTIGRNDFTVLRGMKPKVFKVFKNGEELDSKAADKDNQAHLEQNILKMNLKTFLQVVILGSTNYIPFMAMSAAHRRDCVEDFLDIKVFSTMAVLAKERLRGLKEQLNTLKGDIGNVEYKMEVQKDAIRDMELRSRADEKKFKRIVDDRQGKVSELLKTLERLRAHVGVTMELRDRVMESRPDQKSNEVSKMSAKLEAKIERYLKEGDFYGQNDTCPTCSQELTEETKQSNIHRCNSEINKLGRGLDEAKNVLAKLGVKLRIAGNRDRHIRHIQSSILKYETEIEGLQREIQQAENAVFSISQDTRSIDKERGKLELLTEEKKELKQRSLDLLQVVQEHEIVSNLLKDSGIKTQIVKQYLPVMNKFIRQYLTDLDLPIHFILDEEFKEQVASPLHQDFSYASFSEGQKARIDLSLMFCWREIGKLKNSVSANILFLDEVFSSSLDETGKELLLALIRYKLDDNTRVFVVDHTLSQNFKEKFDRSIVVSRVKGFSQYS